MLTLEHTLTLNKETIESPNLCDKFTEGDLTAIGEHCADIYEADLMSMEPWFRRTSAAMDFAMQVQEQKTFPWPNCSNIIFPLITVGALQFHSRAYPALIPGPEVVQYRVIGPDPKGEKTDRADHISVHMSWQCMEQDTCWESDVDRSLINVPIVGCGWKKTYYDGQKNHNVSEFVLAKDLIVNYWAKSINNALSKTHILPMSPNDIYTRVMSGIFVDVLEENWYKDGAPQPDYTPQDAEEDKRSGRIQPQPNSTTPFLCMEQHCWLDLDADGYAEPYIITWENSSKTVLRITCRFNREQDIVYNSKGEIVRIVADEYFTKVPFIPSPDGGLLDIGFGVLLGPLNESVNTAINQLFDAGTLANTAGGFFGRGAKIRGGVYTFDPFSWNRVDSTGDDIRKSVIPLPVREPSNVMFQLLSLIIGYTEKITSAVDIMAGQNPGQNTPAQTTQAMVEQGHKVYSAIFKRIWRSMKEEFQKLYELNARYLPTSRIDFAGLDGYIKRGDYLGPSSAIAPVADPNVFSDQQRFMQASALLSASKEDPRFDQDIVMKQFLRALKIQDIDRVFLGKKHIPPPQPTEKMQIEMMKAQVQMRNLEWKKLQWLSSLMEQRRLNEAKIVQLEAQAALAVEQAGGVRAGNDIAAFQAKIDGLRMVGDMLNSQVQLAQQGQPDNGQQAGNGTTGGLPQLEGPPNNPTGNGMGQPSAGGAQGGLG